MRQHYLRHLLTLFAATLFAATLFAATLFAALFALFADNREAMEALKHHFTLRKHHLPETSSTFFSYYISNVRSIL